MRKARDRPEKNFHFHFKNRLLLNERGEDTPKKRKGAGTMRSRDSPRKSG